MRLIAASDQPSHDTGMPMEAPTLLLAQTCTRSCAVLDRAHPPVYVLGKENEESSDTCTTTAHAIIHS